LIQSQSSYFLFFLAKQASKSPCEPFYLQVGSESHPLLQNGTQGLCGPNTGNPSPAGSSLTILRCGFTFSEPVSFFKGVGFIFGEAVSFSEVRFQIPEKADAELFAVLYPPFFI